LAKSGGALAMRIEVPPASIGHFRASPCRCRKVAGTGLVLGIVGIVLIIPVVFQWTAKPVEKGADSLGPKLEGASRTVGTAVGTLHRSFNAAREAGVAEIRRARSN
jgi:hypothetical protein